MTCEMLDEAERTGRERKIEDRDSDTKSWNCAKTPYRPDTRNINTIASTPEAGRSVTEGA